ncbi:hypothetical protein [Gimesia maris]|uniref:Cap15 family cyclic dinucleotide receptor domain-containing protein n=1 Tax=Gimesia maris TaxID=122 RepID=UPI003A942E8D
MLTRTHISAFVGLTIVAWLLALWMQGQPVLSLSFIRPFGIVVGLVCGIAAVFNKWAWAWPIFRGWFVDRPDLRGTWEATLISDWTDPTTGEKIGPITGYVVVRQTLASLSVRLMTSESRSHSISHGITKEADEIFRMAVVYRNEPEIELQGKRSEIHHGSLWLEILGEGPECMKGHYWTDRGTRGGMELRDRVRRCFDCYEHANDAFSRHETSSESESHEGADATCP